VAFAPIRLELVLEPAGGERPRFFGDVRVQLSMAG
jgi:hypothetical protein